MRFVLVSLLVLLAACAGRAGDACHTQSDCASGYGCAGPDDGPRCGIGPQQQCGSDQNCPQGERCNAVYDACSTTGVGSICDAPCTATSCGPGFQCNTDSACEPIPCNQDNACASYQRCDASAAGTSGPVYMETNGCTDVTCTSDGQCNAGEACVNGMCQTSIGECEIIMPAA